MAFPAGLTTILVRHKVTDAAGKALRGNLVTAVPVESVWTTGGSIIEHRATATVDADGMWQLVLPHTDQAGIQNRGVPWKVTEHVPGGPRTYLVAPMVAHGAGPIDVTAALVSPGSTSRQTIIHAGPVTDTTAAQLFDMGGQFTTRINTTIGTETLRQANIVVPGAVARALNEDEALGATITQAVEQRVATLSMPIVVTPESFGATGDGVHDDYPAFAAMVTAVNTAGCAVVELAAGRTYHFGRYHSAATPTEHLTWRDLTGLRVVGNGAKIDVAANLHRSAATPDHPVIPFRILNSTNVTIEDVELDGNVAQMTRDPGYGTSALHAGIYLEGCEDVVLRNVNAHHWFNDGLFLTANVTPDVGTGKRRVTKNVVTENCRFTNCGRNNVSALYVRGWTAVNCSFDDAGRTGTYGEHNPTAGVDIEPNSSLDPETRDEYTGDITFINCRWRNNNGAAVVASGPDLTDNVTLLGGEVIIPAGQSTRLGFLMRVRNGLCQGVRFAMADRTVSVSTAGSTDNRATLTYRSCAFTGTSNLYQDSSTGNAVVIEDCDFTVLPGAGPGVRAPYISNDLTVFRNNRVFIPQSVADGRTGSQTVNNIVVDVAESNRYSTDLPESSTTYFISAYGTASAVRHERYLSGTAFREANASVWPNPLPVSRGEQSQGDAMYLGPGAQRRRATFRTSAPTTGVWNRGDKVFNSSPSAGGFEGWVCVTSGTPGTWKTFGSIQA